VNAQGAPNRALLVLTHRALLEDAFHGGVDLRHALIAEGWPVDVTSLRGGGDRRMISISRTTPPGRQIRKSRPNWRSRPRQMRSTPRIMTSSASSEAVALRGVRPGTTISRGSWQESPMTAGS